MREILNQKGHKATPARLAILEVFANKNHPITAENIYKELKRNKKYKNINEATVYRTLATLEQSGILTKVDFRKSAHLFEVANKHHHHITCMKCDAVEDFEDKLIEEALRRVARDSSKFISIKDHSLELFGLCKECKT